MTHFTENGQPYVPAVAFAQMAVITLGSMLAVAWLVERLNSKEAKTWKR